MSRHLITAVAILFCSAASAIADTPDRYTTISTVIRVAEDIDEYLDMEVEEYPTFQNERLAVPDDINFMDDESASVFELSSSNWFAQYDANRRDDLTPPLEDQLTASDSEINLRVDEIVVMPSPRDLRDSEDIQTSLSDSRSSFGEAWADSQRQSVNSPSVAPVIAATSSLSNRAQNAGLWMFLSLMIAPFAWLGWSEYKDLKARSLRSELEQPELESETEERKPCETKSRVMDAARQREEEIEFTEISSESVESEPQLDEDCDREIEMLEEANTLLASVSSLKTHRTKLSERN